MMFNELSDRNQQRRDLNNETNENHDVWSYLIQGIWPKEV